MPGMYVGFDLGTSTVKAIEVSPKGKEYEITGSYILPSPNEAMQDGIVIDYGEMSQQVLKVHESGSFSLSPASTAIKGTKAVLKHARVPFVTEKLLNENLIFLAEQYMSIDPEAYSVDCSVQEVDSTAAIAKVLFSATPHDNLSDYISVFESADLELKNVNIESLALVKLYQFLQLPEDGVSLIMHIGSSGVLYVFIAYNEFVYHDSGASGGGLCSEMLINAGGMSPNNVEEIKANLDSWPEGAKSKDVIVQQYLPELIRDTETAINNYILGGGKPIDRIYFSGGGATTYGMQELFSKHFELDCALMNPTEKLKIIHPIAKQVLENKPAIMNIAIAMSLGSI